MGPDCYLKPLLSTLHLKLGNRQGTHSKADRELGFPLQRLSEKDRRKGMPASPSPERLQTPLNSGNMEGTQPHRTAKGLLLFRVIAPASLGLSP